MGWNSTMLVKDRLATEPDEDDERNGYVPDAPFTPIGMNITECFSYMYLGKMNDLAPEQSRRERTACEQGQ
ncbi:unnamed protein product [Haemonchus placei]|uniref:Uncharacterized protein n=1 Tax=Haemonchus placei TaxID=6290 RepID=A0A0N4VT32_HAEPC|nr:unnamed protein product [Haemonchus placei]